MAPIPSEKRELYPFGDVRPSLSLRENEFFDNPLEGS
jgi:hypothetical protein